MKWLRAVLVFLGLGALCLTLGCAAMQAVGGDLMSSFGEVGAEFAMLKNIESPSETTGILLVSAGIQDELGAEETHSIYAASIINQATPDKKHRVASFNDSLVVFQGLEPGTYSVVQLTDDRYFGSPGRRTVPVGRDPWNNITVTSGGVFYLGKLTWVYRAGGAETMEIVQSWDVDTEAGAWAAVIERYDESPWIPTLESRIAELKERGTDSPMVRLERTISRFEQTAAAAGTQALYGGLAEERAELDEHLLSNPDDREANILSVRVKMLEVLAEPVVLTPGEETSDPFTDEHAFLEETLSENPDDAEAHYWKARMYGLRTPGFSETGRFVYVPVDLDKAIEHAGKAVELSPDDVAYRSALAVYYVEDMRWDEAKQALDTEEGRGTSAYRLLTDAEALILPEGAVYSREDSDSHGERMMNSGLIHDLPQFRVSVYAIPMTTDDVETFYAGIWDGFELIEGDPSVQYLRFVEGGLAPLEPGTTSDELGEAAEANDGILFTFIELTGPDGGRPTETPAGHPLPATFGDTSCFLVFANLR